MLSHLLDTNLIIELLRGTAGAVTQRMDRFGRGLAVSSISVAELEYGVEHSHDPAHMRSGLESLLSLLTVAEFDRVAARHSGQIRHALAEAGTPIGPYDVLIAGHARALGLPLVTHNTREFSRVPDLPIEDWQTD